MNKKLALFVSILTVGSFSLGAATGTRITATLKQQQINYSGSTYNKQVIEYKGTNYVPLREFGNILGTNATYQNGVIYLSGGNQSASSGSVAQASSYSRINPAPVGTSQKVTVDNFSDKYTAEVCVKEVIRGNAAWNKIKEANMFNDEPSADKEYILAKISIKAISVADDKKLDVSKYNFNLYSSSNSEYDTVSVVEPDPALGGSIYTGASTEGWCAFLVNKNDSAPKIVYGQKYDGTGGIWFSLK